MVETKNKSLQQFDTDDPNRIQDVGWTLKEVWRRTRGIVVVSINLITFFILWELLTIYGEINPLFLPKASDMFSELWVGLTTRAPEGAVFSGSILDHFLHSFNNLDTSSLFSGKTTAFERTGSYVSSPLA